jgi:hypothetical protein
MQVETKSASLDTLAVTIQALHVSGKQMTLAVFRQLPMTRAYGDDGALLPLEYWGVVRYSIKDEGDEWVVCASGGRLYRCPLEWHGDSVPRAEREFKSARDFVAWWHQCKAKKDGGEWNLPFAPRGGESWRLDALPAYEERVVASARMLEVCRRAETTRQALARLPQLFIAV